MSNFWKNIPSPFTVLAPMEDVTDFVFREIVAKHLPRPDVFFTEFTSVDGLASRGRTMTIRKFKYSKFQRPIVAQIWGSDPAKMKAAAETVRELGFDGIDINMGCPVPAVMKRKAGAGTIGQYELAARLIQAVKDGAGDMAVSVKTRLGHDTVITDEWVGFLLDQNIDALTIHGRVATQMSKGDANWGEIGRAVKLRNVRAPGTLIVGNGDIQSYAQALDMHHTHGVDGIMIGRGIFHNPWIFDPTVDPGQHVKKEYIDLLIDHVNLYEDTWGRTKNFEMMKKFFKMYVRGFDGANELRQRLMLIHTRDEILAILNETSMC